MENRRDGKAGVPALDEEGQKELIQDVFGSREELSSGFWGLSKWQCCQVRPRLESWMCLV